MDALYERRAEMFFTNLLLLGFDVPYMEKKYGISFKPDMFNVPNQKAFEVVTHFLFSKLNEVSRDEYKILWPVLDKTQEREFMKSCKMHLMKISRENAGFVRFPHVGQILMSPCGSKFYELYMAFSAYVMQKTIAKDKVCRQLYRPTITAENSKDVKEVMQLSTVVSAEEFTEIQKVAMDCHKKWHEAAQNFTSYYRKTKRQIFEKQKLFKEELNALFKSCDENKSVTEEETLQVAVAKSSELLQEVICYWQALEDHLNKERCLWDTVRTELESECPEKVLLEGQKYVISVPDMLKTECRKELLEHGVQVLTENERLSVKNFLNLCHVNLGYYKKLFEEAGLPDSCGFPAEVQRNVNRVKCLLDHLAKLSEKLLSVLPDIVNEKKKLEFTAYAKISAEEIESIKRKLPPPLPVFGYHHNGEASDPVKPQNILALSPESERKFFSSRDYNSSHHASAVFGVVTPARHTIAPSDFKAFDRFQNSSFSQSKLSLGGQPQRTPKPSPFPSPYIKSSIDDIILESRSSQKRNISLRHMSESSVSNCKDVPDLTESMCDPLTLRYDLRAHSVADSFNESSEESSLDPVRKKFVEQLISEYRPDYSDRLSSSDDSFLSSMNATSDILGETAFLCHDKVKRTPPQSIDIRNRSEKMEATELNQVLSSEALESLTSRRFSWPDEEEFLENVTLPDLPI